MIVWESECKNDRSESSIEKNIIKPIVYTIQHFKTNLLNDVSLTVYFVTLTKQFLNKGVNILQEG